MSPKLRLGDIIRYLLNLCSFYFFGDLLTSNSIMYEVMSGDLSFIFNCPIKERQLKYIDQLDNSSQSVLALKYFQDLEGVTDWSVENLNSYI